MDPSHLLTWFGLALGGVGAAALVVGGSLLLLDDVLADRAALDRLRHGPGGPGGPVGARTGHRTGVRTGIGTGTGVRS
jgi:hypothetical protein